MTCTTNCYILTHNNLIWNSKFEFASECCCNWQFRDGRTDICQCKLGIGQFRLVRRGKRNFGGTKSQILRQSAEEMILQYRKGSGAPFAGYAGNFLCWRNNSFRIFKGPSSQGRSKAVKATDRGSRRGRGRNIQQEFPDEGKMRASWFRH